MKENLKKIKIIVLLIVSLLNHNCLNVTAQKKDEVFNDYLENKINDRKFSFLEINFIKKCSDNQFLFSLSEMSYNDNISKRYKIYTYNNTLIIYDIDEYEKDKDVIDFFDSYLKRIKYDIYILPKGNQSLINATALYFKNGKLITDDTKIHSFMESNCK
ncbi:hypothetical protein [Chryseobacterium sp. JUb7]|uniref:hypothetical protein n=1 Tax=Chryseobacterium sp. JUb7 TaxID=2940599 RepID=UPI00216A3ECB|nr:hypothetical protein [Chryseobacterium sp. JUb7]MCS3529064.1 hypothetical protein [Chryseobacterium sp. JUb7]